MVADFRAGRIQLNGEGFGSQVARRADFQRYLALGKDCDQVRIAYSRDAVADALGAEKVDRIPYLLRSARFPRVSEQAQASFSCFCVHRPKILERERQLVAAKTESHNAFGAELDGVFEYLHCRRRTELPYRVKHVLNTRALSRRMATLERFTDCLKICMYILLAQMQYSNR